MHFHCEGSWEVNLCLTQSHSRGACHYEFMGIDEGVPPDDSSDTETASLSGDDGRGLILSLYWWLAVVPKSVLQPQRPTGQSESETCSISTSRTYDV